MYWFSFFHCYLYIPVAVFNAWLFLAGNRWDEDNTNTKSSKKNNKPCVDALQGWGEKCCLLNEGAPTAVWPCKYTGLPEILVAKLVKAVMEDKRQFIKHQSTLKHNNDLVKSKIKTTLPIWLLTIRWEAERQPGALELSGGGGGIMFSIWLTLI